MSRVNRDSPEVCVGLTSSFTILQKPVSLVSLQCGRNREVLQQCYFLQERAVSIQNSNADYVTELGFELLLQSRPKDAVKCFRNAMKLDETSVTALTGANPNNIVDICKKLFAFTGTSYSVTCVCTVVQIQPDRPLSAGALTRDCCRCHSVSAA